MGPIAALAIPVPGFCTPRLIVALKTGGALVRYPRRAADSELSAPAAFAAGGGGGGDAADGEPLGVCPADLMRRMAHFRPLREYMPLVAADRRRLGGTHPGHLSR